MPVIGEFGPGGLVVPVIRVLTSIGLVLEAMRQPTAEGDAIDLDPDLETKAGDCRSAG